MDPKQLSHELREVKTPDLDRRRQIIGLSMVGATMGQLVSLYQTGVIDHLPDPPVPFFVPIALMLPTTPTAASIASMGQLC